MKNLIWTIAFFSFIFGSCVNENKGADNSEKKDVSLVIENIASDDCETYLEQYEEWTKNYITTLKIFKSKPSDPKYAQNYSTQTRHLAKWKEKWTKHMQCSSDDQYLNRYTEICNKVEKEQKRLQAL